MKILTLCEGGSCRSVAMVYELRDRYGHDAIAYSLKRAQPETLATLCDWAEMILLADESLPDRSHVTQETRDELNHSASKVFSLRMPHDEWHDPRHQRLRSLIRRQIREHESVLVRELLRHLVGNKPRD